MGVEEGKWGGNKQISKNGETERQKTKCEFAEEKKERETRDKIGRENEETGCDEEDVKQ